MDLNPVKLKPSMMKVNLNSKNCQTIKKRVNKKTLTYLASSGRLVTFIYKVRVNKDNSKILGDYFEEKSLQYLLNSNILYIYKLRLDVQYAVS